MEPMPQNVRKYIGWSLLALLGLFIVFNLTLADVNLLIMQVKMPVAILIFLSAAMGAGATYAFQFIKGQKRGEEPKGPDTPA